MTHPSGFFRASSTVLYQEPNTVVFSAFQSVNIFVWTGSATDDTTRAIGRIVEGQLRRDAARRLSTVHVMTQLATPPTSEARAGFAQIAKRWEHTISAVSLVFEREGFWGSAMRSAITSVLMLLPTGQYPIKVHRSIDETASWLPRQHQVGGGEKMGTGPLLRALEETRDIALAGHLSRDARTG